ncbi:SRPBCC domain-containing protein [Leptospira fletcheri]|uniref:SRPBCC domain-containing protein n=1 Tax=Leptospira fletcheri TaxID=2484981 RepID=A0A4R9GCR2_9LEPT|nr:SRPBCC domain-containing protein [Leptospira fletcheri]TGK08970.1 SRPBCC domain-containing protein [Leptospira fletcheri]
MTKEVLKVEKKINAEPARLFRAWLKPDELARWFLCCNEMGVGIGSVSMDPRPGGKFQIDMTLDGKVLPHTGEYKVIEEPTRLVFTWRSHMTGDQDTLVTVTFAALPEITVESEGKTIRKPQTLVTLTHELLPTKELIEAHHRGWTNIIDGLEHWHVGKE